MKKVVALICCAVFLILAAGASFAAEKTWKLAHIRPEGTAIDISLKEFASQVKEKTAGRINIEIYPASQLGDYTTVQERVSIGDVEMQCGPLSPAVVRAIGLNSLPYIVINYEEAEKAYGPDGVIVQKMNEYMAKQDLHVLGSWPVYFGGIVLTKEPPAPGDISVPKNIKIRVPPIRSFELSATALGYQATPIPWADAFTAMQTGIVEGAIGGGAEGYYANFRDLAKYYLPLNDHFESWFLYINNDVWKGISEEDRKSVTAAARAIQEARWKVVEADEKTNTQRLADLGVKIIDFTDAELEEMRRKHAEEVWPQLYNEIPEADIKAVLDSLK
jgi:TRAP-type C4-dicarboxylate transport system substrate-binding protein